MRLWTAFAAWAGSVFLNGPAMSAPPPRYGGALGVYANDTTFAFAQEQLEALTREPLFRIGQDGTPEPVLARHLEVVGGELHLVLQDNVVFHDGSRLDAASVVAWLEGLARPGGRSGHLTLPIEGARLRLSGQSSPLGARVIDAHTVGLRLAHPFPDLSRLWAGPRSGLEMSRGKRRVGTGPFALGRHPLEVRAFSRHREGRPYADMVELQRATHFGLETRAQSKDAWVIGAGPTRCPNWALFPILVVRGSASARALIDQLIDRPRLARRFLAPGSKPARRFFGSPRPTSGADGRPLDAILIPGRSPGADTLAKRIQLDLTRGGVTTAIAREPPPGSPLVLELKTFALEVQAHPLDRLGMLMGLAARLGRAEAVPAGRLESLAASPVWRHAALVDRLEAELRETLNLVVLARIPIKGQTPFEFESPSPCQLAAADLPAPTRTE